jgi:hypothetical protein
VVFADFAHAHPELGYAGSADSWVRFQRNYGERLEALDVIRRTPVRMIADTDRFEEAVFELLTRSKVDDDHTPAAA